VSRVPALPRVGLLEAVDDPRLLGAAFEPWPVQREWLGAIEQGPRLHVVAGGRRIGKTLTPAVAAVWSCTLRPELRERLRLGEFGYAVGVSVNLRQSRLFVGAARSIVERSPLLAPLLESSSDDELVFGNGMRLAGFPCTSRGGRGWPIHTLVFDEAAHHVDGEGNAAFEQIWRALTPSVAQFGELGRVVVTSTPAGSVGLFPDLWRRAEAGELEGARAYRATTREGNPTIDEAFLASERLMLGEDAYRAEYEAEFTAGGGAFFDSAEVRAVVGSRREALPDEGTGWLAALDPSSGGGDPFALVVVGLDARPGFEGRLLVGHVERFLPRRGGRLSRRTRAERDLWVDAVLDRVAGVVRRFGAAVVSDQHVPGVVVDELAKRGVRGVRIRPWTSASRTEAMQTLRARIGTERIELAKDEQLVAELCRVVSRFRGGAPVVEVPRVGDSHGDLALALAAGVFELDRFGVTRSPARMPRPRGGTLRRGSLAGVSEFGAQGREW
jgi:hypothetical protein